MSIFSKARVKTAIESRSRLNLSHQHITTADFMQLNCAFARELVPTQSIDIDFTTYSRLAALNFPTFGDCSIHHHAFFVPYRTVFPGWNDFINDTIHVGASGGTRVDSVPASPIVFNASELTGAFLTDFGADDAFLYAGTSSDFDISIKSGTAQSPTTTYYHFSPIGRQAFKIINQLGYKLETDITSTDYPLNALPLACIARVFIDYYYPSQYVGFPDYNEILATFRFDKGGASLSYTAAVIKKILSLITFVCWDSDYFTAAFDNPVGPHSTLFDNNTQIEDSSYTSNANHSRVVLTPQGTPAVVNTDNSTGQAVRVTDYIVKALHRLTDYMKRHQLAGSRTLDLYLARFGVSLNPDMLNQSYMIGHYSTPVTFGAVMSNSDTSGASLGDFAGQGYAWNENGKGHFSFTAEKEYGMFFILSSIVPKIGYVQGIDRSILHTSRFDFYTPEFDALGSQAISKAELYVDQSSSSRSSMSLGALRDSVFGFTPRYAEYKTIQDKLTGDYQVKSLNGVGLTSDSWHLFRLFNPSAASEIVHSQAFVFPTQTGFNNAGQFRRIFQSMSATSDHFFIQHVFNIESSFPGRPLFDNYDFDDHSGKEIDIEAGGVRVN